MNDSSAQSVPGASLVPSGIEALTTIHFVILGLVAAAIIAMIIAGMRRKRAQDVAMREVAQHAEEAGVTSSASEPATTTPLAQHERLVPDEPIAAAAPLEANPAAQAADAPVASTEPVQTIAPTEPATVESSAAANDGPHAPVTQLKGLGPKVAARLAELGIITVGHLASLTDHQAATLDADLGPFSGRMARDRWIEQARLLAAGDRAGFEATFGRL
jgi:predicted flap endonuclease-1-like 5' DNA nuclease